MYTTVFEILLSIQLIVVVDVLQPEVQEDNSFQENKEIYKTSYKVNKFTKETFENLIAASEKKMPYFSAQLFYQYYTKNTIYEKKSSGDFIPLDVKDVSLDRIKRYEIDAVPLFYGIDLAHCEKRGWFSGEDANKRRATVISIVRKAWLKNKAVPVVSWHLENPYVPHAYNNSVAATYNVAKEITIERNKVFRYPEAHTNVPKEIMNKVKYDDGIQIKDRNGYWLPSNSSTKCGFGRSNGVDEVIGYDSPAEWYEAKIQDICNIINEFVDENGEGIPVVLRLFHECETRFAWWGYGVSKKDFIKFFQYSVDEIRKQCNHKNILFAYCKDRYWDANSYGDRYPGDDYVDIVGFDDYTICTSDTSDNAVIERMRIITDFANKHGKVAALFETGNKTEYGRSHRFLSENLYNCIMAERVNLGLVQLWSTFTTEGDIKILNDYKEFVRKPGIQMFTKRDD